MQKYEFTGVTKTVNGTVVKQIRALIKIESMCVEVGTIGGWLEKETNLSHEGNCFVFDQASVRDNGRVIGNAMVREHATVFGRATIYDNAYVCGRAKVGGSCLIQNSAYIGGDCEVKDDANVGGYTRVYEQALIAGYAEVNGDVSIRGYAEIFGNAYLNAEIAVSGRAYINGGVTTASRSDGYTFALLPYKDRSYRITAGCRFFTMAEAMEHWTSSRGGTPLGDETFAILDFFRKMAALKGLAEKPSGDGDLCGDCDVPLTTTPVMLGDIPATHRVCPQCGSEDHDLGDYNMGDCVINQPSVVSQAVEG